jgi:hypothetical protein
MPFADGARISVESECDDETPFPFYYYVDYETGQAPGDDVGRFHAHWRREWPTRPDGDHANVTGDGNYLLADVTGRGQYIATILNIDSPSIIWYGEGDDMFFIDGEDWPPSLHGTGTEDYFNTAWCPREYATGPHHGLIHSGRPHSRGYRFVGKSTYYRFHVNDPITFRKSLRAMIEHGHGNEFVGDWSSTAFWYSLGESRPLPALPPVEKRLPLPVLSLETGTIVDVPHKSLSYFFAVGDGASKAAGDTLVDELAAKWEADRFDEAAARKWSADVERERVTARAEYLAASGREVVVPKMPAEVVLSIDAIHGSHAKAPRSGEVRLAYDDEGLTVSGSFEILRREKEGFAYDTIDIHLAEPDWSARFVAVSVTPTRLTARCLEHREDMDDDWGSLEEVEGAPPAVKTVVTDKAWSFETKVPWSVLGIAPASGKRIDCNVDRWNYQDHPWWASWALTPHHYYHPRMGGVIIFE